MARPRALVVRPDEVQTFHCMSRCVRQSPLLRSEVDDRKSWFHQRLIELATAFSIDLVAVSLMDTHFHTQLTTRPDLAREFTAHEVARRWFGIYPKSVHLWARQGLAAHPDLEARRHSITGALSDEDAIEAVARQTARIESLRLRLSCISEFQKVIKQEVARRVNKLDGTSGHFWDSRFKSIEVVDEPGRLMVAMYIDLNPVRAAICDRPEDSPYTSVRDRILVRQYLSDDEKAEQRSIGTRDAESGGPPRAVGRKSKGRRRRQKNKRHALHATSSFSRPTRNEVRPLLRCERERDPDRAVWLAPIQDALGIALDHYLSLIDQVGRLVRSDKRGAIPESLPPMLERLGLKLDDLAKLGRRKESELHGTVIGGLKACRRAAERRGLKRVVNALA